MTLQQDLTDVGRHNTSAGTHAAIALEAQGAPERVCRRGMVAAQ